MERAERARRRHGDEAPAQDDDNPCPSVIDPITLEPVVTPAISPYGHVMGQATWNAVLAEQGKCPFTQQPLRRDQVGSSALPPHVLPTCGFHLWSFTLQAS